MDSQLKIAIAVLMLYAAQALLVGVALVLWYFRTDRAPGYPAAVEAGSGAPSGDSPRIRTATEVRAVASAPVDGNQDELPLAA